jgi:hypothetical protein
LSQIQRLYDTIGDLPEYRWMYEGYASSFLMGGGVARGWFSGNTLLGKAFARFPNILEFKKGQMIRQVSVELAPAFKAILDRGNRNLWKYWSKSAGSDDPAAVMYHFLDERLGLTEGGAAAAKMIDDIPLPAKPAGIGDADWETTWQAFRVAFSQKSEAAYQTHYFNPRRAWWERSLNHPFLGFYPLSYMWGKVLPEFARFLLLRPFGLNAPLTGLEAMNRVNEHIQVALANDPDGFAGWVEDHANAIYALAFMLPGTPFDLPVNAPGWLRHIAEGRAKDPARFVGEEAINALGYAATYGYTSLLEGAGDFFQDLLNSTSPEQP